MLRLFANADQARCVPNKIFGKNLTKHPFFCAVAHPLVVYEVNPLFRVDKRRHDIAIASEVSTDFPTLSSSSLSPAVIIDDDEFFRVAMDIVLRDRFGVDKVVICETADDAMQQFASGTRFGLGLVDLNMPGVENRSFLDKLKALQPGIRLSVMSASRSRADILMTLAAGGQGFINKGLGIGEAEIALRRIADGAVYVPPFTPQSADEDAASGAKDENVHASLASLTPRQVEVLELLVAGQPNKGIARSLDINPSTVKFHLSLIFRILGAANRVEAALEGARLLNARQ